jgi:hypothetical protein
MSKFKVGDKVNIVLKNVDLFGLDPFEITRAIRYNPYRISATTKQKHYDNILNKLVNTFYLEEDRNFYYWNENLFERINDQLEFDFNV